MVAFARARTRSLLSKLWPMIVPERIPDKLNQPDSEQFNESRIDQKESFFNAIKDGGIWFS
ncbi:MULTISPECIES: hypothetical protein [unclassified Prochlorococcus]|uniref:hypothetical protein n=1 Tax=unclassified Prochlorococcus TaxID=2627481 RepID=UPI0005338727|nr:MULTISPECIES: hypothetical protein [unclassified Prochlorococcus]KGG16173.1 hypothetical protein EV06_0883 [Prochlorococcus sp. MIT 0602]KGG17293.1 hypothetical protein EV07_0731 [Prochlorococcus sp. MIT 0603]